MDLAFWALFALTVFTASMVPGPSTLIAFTHGARFGWKQALATALGNMSASVVQALLACAGLGIVLAKSAMLFMAIKYAGAAYLVYLGFSMWRSSSDGIDMTSDTRSSGDTSGRLYRSGFLVAAANPKAIVFFTALFPQFLDPSGTAVSQLTGMVMLIALVSFLVAMIYGCLGSRLSALQLTRRFMGRVHKTIGGLFIASGIGLAASRG
ncbi:LysE family translocator [Roseibium denhamense]|uniref:Threonine/homoserine/homoserine lactone efflux protein n=1 Tax=Roseibium denhamense TaxID=76305 RepID=A0ABY1NS50_9HYPH|nr:LysE family translocator [Roseibium denhamense]MTI08112.1 LysE family translocator [Roseibium denhamense]SMP16503.1 Threonine/homoserine/homoserine lactone efflux protein [Roseibium denhamense]